MEDLNFDNIIDEDFDNFIQDPEDNHKKEETPDENIESEITEVDELEVNSPESVGDALEEHEERENAPDDNGGTSPQITFSSLTNALAEEGVFPDLPLEKIQQVKSAQDFVDLVKAQIEAGLDETQKRINDAMNSNVEITNIQKYEATLKYLNDVEGRLEDEGDEGIQIRQRLIYNDFLNKGIDKDRALKLMQRSFDAGTDIDDARDALASSKQFFSDKYTSERNAARQALQEKEASTKKSAEALKKSIMDDEKLFGDLQVDKQTRSKIYDSVTKPVFKDASGNYLTEIAKFQAEHPEDYLKYVGLAFTLTNGFTNMNGLLKGKVRTEVKKGMKEIENVLQNSTRQGGKLDFLSSLRDPESRASKFDLDI